MFVKRLTRKYAYISCICKCGDCVIHRTACILVYWFLRLHWKRGFLLLNCSSLAGVPCGLSLRVHHHSAGYIFYFLLGSLNSSWLFWKSNTGAKGARGVGWRRKRWAHTGYCSLANYNVACERESNRVFDFRDFVCYLFPKAILFYSTISLAYMNSSFFKLRVNIASYACRSICLSMKAYDLFIYFFVCLFIYFLFILK